MEANEKRTASREPLRATPGIVIRYGMEPPRRPMVTAFIWGGKVRPVPAIPYGRRSA